MTDQELDRLEALLAQATPRPWALWDSCSWRRFGSEATGREIITPTNHPGDGHVDLTIPNHYDAKLLVAVVNARPRPDRPGAHAGEDSRVLHPRTRLSPARRRQPGTD